MPSKQGPGMREVFSTDIYKILYAGVTEPTTSKWVSPIVLVPKMDGSLRFCVHYQGLNEKTLDDAYPLPRIDGCIDSLGDAAI